MILAFSFPNPIEWVVDKVAGFAGDAATAGFEMVIGGLTAWILDAVVWVVGGVFHFFLDATDPNVQADWFAGRGGPYATTAAIGATLLVGFVLAGITQGVGFHVSALAAPNRVDPRSESSVVAFGTVRRYGWEADIVVRIDPAGEVYTRLDQEDDEEEPALRPLDDDDA